MARFMPVSRIDRKTNSALISSDLTYALGSMYCFAITNIDEQAPIVPTLLKIRNTRSASMNLNLVPSHVLMNVMRYNMIKTVDVAIDMYTDIVRAL